MTDKIIHFPHARRTDLFHRLRDHQGGFLVTWCGIKAIDDGVEWGIEDPANDICKSCIRAQEARE